MHISFEQPLALILIPIGIALIIWVSRFFRTVNKNKKNRRTAMRVVIFTLVVLALAGISISMISKQASTVFLVDCSDSMKASVGAVETFVEKQIEHMPDKNQVAVVAFGSDTKVAQFMTKEKSYAGIEDKPVSTATDIEGAITTALSLFPEGGGKRIVLISDGIENEGDMLSMANSIDSAGVEIDVLPVTEQVSDEVYIDDLTVPDTIKIGDKYAVTVKVMSNVKTEADVSLFLGRKLKGQEHVKVNVGENSFVFYDEAEDTGTRNYRAEIVPYKDTTTVNNEYSAFAQIDVKDRVLIVEGKKGEADSLAAAVNAGGVAYDIVTPTGAPSSINDMIGYKSIILANVYYDDLKSGFTNNIESYVKNYAGGLLIVGGEDSYALGGYKNTVLEELSPVALEPEGENNIPKMAFYMVIDHSGSMDTPASDNVNITSLDLAKSAARKSLDSLRDTDEVGVLAFDDKFQWVVEPTELNDRETVADDIGSIKIEGGTSIYPALKEAVDRIKESDAAIKHVVLLTDGEDDYVNYGDVLDEINGNGITLSTVAIGPESATGIMKYLANEGGGRYYYTDVNTGLPRIFAKEVYLACNEYIINEEFVPVIASDDDSIKALSEGCPSLMGYIATSMKSTSKELLKTGRGDPLLASWQYGLGHVIAWTSDGSGEWTGNWASWDKYPEFIRNLIDSSIANVDLDGDVVKAEQKGSKGVITYETKEYSEDTKIEAIVTDEEGNESKINLNAKTPGHYEAEINTDKIGVYNIAVTNSNKDGIVKSANTATAMQYSPEYRFYEDTNGLDKLVSLCDGVKLDFKSKVFKKMPSSTLKDKNITDFLLILALLLFMYDVICRRLNISLYDKVAVKFSVRRSKKKEEAIKREAVSNKASKSVKEEPKAAVVGDAKESSDVKVKESKKAKKVKE
ncbi:MAG: VWA domain-containing protein, partial [Lachnospiraceae bacterium]|nr:VWA domain-containing protein [Lachnospiraceae bacterium]